MSVTDEFLEANRAYAAQFEKGDLPMPPARQTAVLACMDARLDPARVLGLEEGDVHVIRNAGGVVTADEIRSLAISQRLLGTKEIILNASGEPGTESRKVADYYKAFMDESGIESKGLAPIQPELDSIKGIRDVAGLVSAFARNSRLMRSSPLMTIVTQDDRDFFCFLPTNETRFVTRIIGEPARDLLPVRSDD